MFSLMFSFCCTKIDLIGFEFFDIKINHPSTAVQKVDIIGFMKLLFEVYLKDFSNLNTPFEHCLALMKFKQRILLKFIEFFTKTKTFFQRMQQIIFQVVIISKHYHKQCLGQISGLPC